MTWELKITHKICAACLYSIFFQPSWPSMTWPWPCNIARSSTVTFGNMLNSSCVNCKSFLHMEEPQKLFISLSIYYYLLAYLSSNKTYFTANYREFDLYTRRSCIDEININHCLRGVLDRKPWNNNKLGCRSKSPSRSLPPLPLSRPAPIQPPRRARPGRTRGAVRTTLPPLPSPTRSTGQ